MKIRICATALALVLSLPAQAQTRDLNVSTVTGPGGATQVTAEIWVDNWFTLWVNGTKVIEDSTPYKTERSFNAERVTFSADLPMTVAIELRDFMENETGLEYIGTNRQQLGDGGAIVQFFDAGGAVLGVSDASWRCHVAQHAPVDTSCARENAPGVDQGACAQETSPLSNWQAVGYDDSGWPDATVHSARDVGPKDGYDQIKWDSSAELIWGPSLKQDNILYCRATID